MWRVQTKDGQIQDVSVQDLHRNRQNYIVLGYLKDGELVSINNQPAEPTTPKTAAKVSTNSNPQRKPKKCGCGR